MPSSHGALFKLWQSVCTDAALSQAGLSIVLSSHNLHGSSSTYNMIRHTLYQMHHVFSNGYDKAHPFTRSQMGQMEIAALKFNSLMDHNALKSIPSQCKTLVDKKAFQRDMQV